MSLQERGGNNPWKSLPFTWLSEQLMAHAWEWGPFKHTQATLCSERGREGKQMLSKIDQEKGQDGNYGSAQGCP